MIQRYFQLNYTRGVSSLLPFSVKLLIDCATRSDRGDGTKRCEQKKNSDGVVFPLIFPPPLNSRRTPLCELLEQAKHLKTLGDFSWYSKISMC